MQKLAPLILAATLALLPTLALAQTANDAVAKDAVAKADKAIEKGLAFLASKQSPSGLWEAQRGAAAISGLALKAFAQSEKHAKDPNITKGFDELVRQELDGKKIYENPLASYNTAIILSALAKHANPKHDPAIADAIKYLRSLQWSDSLDGMPKGEKVAPGDPRIGGWGYGSKGRPDGSNTAFAIDALRDAGVSQDDPAFKAAAAFMSSLQNNKATNKESWAGDDGGFIYSHYNGGETFAKSTTRPDGIKELASYGTMTYAGLKSLVYAGVSKDDPRVVAAYGWITQRFSLTENPNMVSAGAEKATDGLYYYYHVLARALKAYGRPDVPASTPVDWRVALIDQLSKVQHEDGSWVGTRAYMETNPVLVTAYSILALQEATADLKANPPK